MAVFTNQARLSYNNTITNSNIATGELVDDLTATKTATADSYEVGGENTYIISIVNSGNSDYTGLTVSDDLGGYVQGNETRYPLDIDQDSIRYYINGVLQAAPSVTAGPPFAFTGIRVPAQGNAMIMYDATANGLASPEVGGSIENTATITGTGLAEPVLANVLLDASTEPQLSISKAISPATVTPGSRVTYTFIIQNNGNSPADALDNVTITDTFDPILTDLAVAYDGTVWAETTNYTYNDATGEFATVAGGITVPAATFTQDETTGEWSSVPGSVILTVTGTI